MRNLLRSHNWIVTAALAAGAIAYVYFVFLPRQRALHDAHERLRAQRSQVLEAERLTFASRELEESLGAAEACVDAWRAAAPGEHRLSEFYGQVNAWAEARQVAIEQFTPGPVERFDDVWRLPLRLGGRAEFASLLAFVRELESQPATAWVTHLEMTPIESEAAREPAAAAVEAPGQPLRFEMTLVIYSARPRGAKPA